MNHLVLKCILIDDEKNSRIVLKNLLSDFCKEVEVIGEAANPEDAYTLISNKKPDLVFLDIQMPTGSGFTLLKKFREISFEVIFITGFDQYAINAIKFNALDYLLKPVDIHELQMAVQKAIARMQNKTDNRKQIVNLVTDYETQTEEKQIALHKNDVVRLIKISQISHIESSGNYSHIFTTENETLTSSKTLKEFEDYLTAFNFFLRIHKNCILNIRQVQQYSKGDPCFITTINGATLEISRRKKQEVLSILKRN